MLQQYITEVLFKQQTCSIPQVGTFTMQHIPAHYAVVEQVLTPPRQQVNFETRWEDDGSCLHWISQKENLVEPVAKLKMEKYLQDFRESLQTGQPVDLPGIGNLRLDPFGQIRFTPQELPDTWQPIALQPVLRPETAPKVLQGNTEVVNQEVVEHMTVVPEEFESQGRFRWWWVAVPAVLVAGVVSWFLLKDQLQEYTPVKEAVEAPIAAPEEAVTEDSAAIAAVAAVTPAAPVNDTITYFVVFQTFKTKKDAEKNHAKRMAWGHKEVVLYTSEDSTLFNLAVPFRSLPADTAMAKDAVSKKFSAAVRIEYSKLPG